MDEVKFEIAQFIASISVDKNGWSKELNMVSWNGKAPKYDIRSWSADHKQTGKGITLKKEELVRLQLILKNLLDK